MSWQTALVAVSAIWASALVVVTIVKTAGTQGVAQAMLAAGKKP